MDEKEKMPDWMLKDHSEECLRKLYDAAKFVKEEMSFESFLEEWAYQRTQAAIIANNLKNFYVTFGLHPDHGSRDFYITLGLNPDHGIKKNNYVLIHAPSEKIARDSMVKRYGLKWCASYTEEEWTDPSVSHHLGDYKKFDEWTVTE